MKKHCLWVGLRGRAGCRGAAGWWLRAGGWYKSSTKVLGCACGGVVSERIVRYQSTTEQKLNGLWASIVF